MSVCERITITFDKFSWIIDYNIHGKLETCMARFDKGKQQLIMDLLLTLQRKAKHDRVEQEYADLTNLIEVE